MAVNIEEVLAAILFPTKPIKYNRVSKFCKTNFDCCRYFCTHKMPNRSSKIKAAFLLTVFALNTVVGFACASFGIFHQAHHHDGQAVSPKHDHNHHEGSHKSNHAHKHQHGKAQHHQHPAKGEKDGDDCCSDSVVSLQKIDKTPSRSIEAPNSEFVAAFVLAYLIASPLSVAEGDSFPQYVRWRVPTTIQDLRIVIQSFQI